MYFHEEIVKKFKVKMNF